MSKAACTVASTGDALLRNMIIRREEALQTWVTCLEDAGTTKMEQEWTSQDDHRRPGIVGSNRTQNMPHRELDKYCVRLMETLMLMRAKAAATSSLKNITESVNTSLTPSIQARPRKLGSDKRLSSIGPWVFAYAGNDCHLFFFSFQFSTQISLVSKFPPGLSAIATATYGRIYVVIVSGNDDGVTDSLTHRREDHIFFSVGTVPPQP
ncbi:uncharacterized protein TRIVIDRAFT_62595 [Trichoderma virens Gv29-8]|uniref:Uncharacterized protein n=1 Tax=Hypocrea virens (strain Gv29-8 / FGSC 10586) TaxID=413071 RepID=G9MFN7_HYPVG|nr:uncharacterized protein TRIVIDRAFT_62595 [Trichoderma virens Gv29-8]EHK26785.1 hypothetical protein TRIVIDRAFT_62595 [Trichoderma virens Gv29-8]UKZ57238.1 hypothetical protein TrVGV298_011091 [Trichoderma virens]